MSSRISALRYATRFRCTAEACEDTCCAGLKVPIEQPAYERLRVALDGSTEDRTAFALHVLREEEADRTLAGFARMRPGASGHCGFLQGGLCGLHRRFGEAVLPDVCASFPRAATPVPEGWRVTASLACPEAARLCLLAEDAMDEVPAPEGLLPRPPSPVPGEATSLGLALQRAAIAVHQVREVPISSQLLTLAQLAMRPSADEVLALASPDSVRAVHAQLRELVFPWPKVARLLLTALHDRAASATQPRYDAWAARLRERLATAGAETPEDTFALYQSARDALDTTFGPRVARYFRHYALYQWSRFPVDEAPAPIAYVCRLSLRVALLRFTLALSAADARSPEALDAAAVETFQLVAKHLEQHPSFRALLDSVLDCSEGDRFAKTLMFASFA